MNTEWSVPAFVAAIYCAEDPKPRRRWDGQDDWDAEHMVTESTRFTIENDARLREICRQAGVTRYYLIAYLLHTFMAAWDAGKEKENGSQRTDHAGGGRSDPARPV